jgi:hypothetical protein
MLHRMTVLLSNNGMCYVFVSKEWNNTSVTVFDSELNPNNTLIQFIDYETHN